MEPRDLPLSELANPYEFANPITDPDRFAGRGAEIKDIRYYLRQAKHVQNPVNLALVGERAAGKTSLLNIIEHEARQAGLLTARINLNSADSDPMRLFWKVFESVVDAMSEAGVIFPPGSDEEQTYRRIVDGLDPSADHPSFPLRFPAHYAVSVNGGRQISENKLSRDLVHLFRISTVPCVLLFDECNVLATSRVALEMLRNVFMNTPGYMLVLTGTPTMFPMFDDVFSPIIRQFKKVSVQPFRDPSDTEACIEGPLQAVGLSPALLVPDEYTLYRHVHQLSGGRPYEIQLLCHFMFRAVQEERAKAMALTRNVIDDVLQELELSASSPGSSRPVLAAVRNLKKRQLSALGVLAPCSTHAAFDDMWFAHRIKSTDDAFTRQELQDHFQDLVERKILTVTAEGNISFAGDDFEKIYLSYFAESQNLQVRIDSMPYQPFLLAALYDRLATPRAQYSVGSGTDSWVEEALSALLAQDLQEVPRRASELCRWIIESGDADVLKIRRISLRYQSYNVTLWSPCLSLAEESVRDSALAELLKIVEEHGATLTSTTLTFPLPGQAQFIDRLLATTDSEVLAGIGADFATRATIRYFGGEYDKAFREAELALQFPNDNTLHANNIGYIHMANGDFDSALAALSGVNPDRDPTADTSALLLINRAVCHIALKEWVAAKRFTEDARKTLSPDDERTVSCLLVPAIREGRLELVEVLTPKLMETVAALERFLESVDSVTGSVTIRRAERAAGAKRRFPKRRQPIRGPLR
ncbi:hypothetical protein [Micromonospora chalcea]|uniref:hypothetical protein n=1 Tax=Micromonospora chalcea TaxID=1874 RepID=UPI00380393BE